MFEQFKARRAETRSQIDANNEKAKRDLLQGAEELNLAKANARVSQELLEYSDTLSEIARLNINLEVTEAEGKSTEELRQQIRSLEESVPEDVRMYFQKINEEQND